jgi:hypothetical protein
MTSTSSPIGVDDDLLGDALLPLLVARSSLHPVSSFAYQASRVPSLRNGLDDQVDIGPTAT